MLTQARALYWALGAITVAGLGLRLFALDRESLWMDELVTVETYALPLTELVPMAAELGQPPLENLIGWLLDRAGLTSDWWVRLPPVVFGSAGVLLLGLWIGRIASPGAGIAAAAMLAVAPLHVVMSQEARPYAICFFFALSSVLVFEWAWKRDDRRGWLGFGAVFLSLLMTRWTDPHFVGLGILAYALHASIRHRRFEPALSAGQARARLWRLMVTVAAAYVVYAPVFWTIWQHSPKAIGGLDRDPAALAWTQLRESFLALICGYSTRTVFTALPGSPYIVAPALLLFAGGLIVLGMRLFRGSVGGLGLFAATIATFPIGYAAVYAMMANAVPKPQYLLLAAALVFGCIGIALDGFRAWVSRHDRRLGIVGFATGLLGLLVPMATASAERLEAIDKRNWRGVMTHLREHAAPGDAFAVAAADTVPSSFHPSAFGRVWYGLGDARFLRIGQGAEPADFAKPAWQSKQNTLWLLMYTDRMYTGTDRIRPPHPRDTPARIHAFHGLFLIEWPADEPAADRLMRAIDLLYEQTPAGASLVWPGVLQAAYWHASGDTVAANHAFESAVRQCRSSDEAARLREWRASKLLTR